MFELADRDVDALVFTIVNLTECQLGVIKGAEVTSSNEFFAQPMASDLLITVVGKAISCTESLRWPDITTCSGIKLLIFSPECELALTPEMCSGYDGVIQCETALTTSLLKDLIEPLTDPKIISIDYQDLNSFFSTNQGIVYYQRYVLADNQCPELVIPIGFKQPNMQLGLLLILTTHEDTDLGLLQAVSRRVADIKSVALSVLGDRQDEQAPEALGVLWFESLLC